MVLTRLKNRKQDHDGKLTGIFDLNPILDTVVYNVETSVGNIQECPANAFATNLWNQVHRNGYDYNLR